MRRCRLLILLSLLFTILGLKAASADKPRLMLNADGPVGSIRTIAFSPDSKTLYAAGSGKVVNTWKIFRGPAGPQAIPAQPLRWEIARGMRGRVYAMDVSGNDGRVAIGGYGARDATGDLLVFDPGRPGIQSILPESRPGIPRPGPQPGHTQPIVSIDFSPAGQQLLTLSNDGEVRWWPPQGGSVIVQQAGTVTDGRVQAAAFLSEDRLAFPQVDRSQPAASRMVLVNPQRPGRPARVVPQPIFWYGIADIALAPDGADFAVSDRLGEVTLFSNDDRLSPRPLNRPRPQVNGRYSRTVASLDYGRLGLLAVSTNPDPGGTCWLELWDTRSNPPALLAERDLGRGPAAAIAAISPDGRLVAATRADRSALELIPLGTADAPLQMDRAVELRSRGRLPESVAFVGSEGYRIAVGEADSPDRFQFDLVGLEIRNEPAINESRPMQDTRWRAIPRASDANGLQELELVPPGHNRPQCAVILDVEKQGSYLTHAWLTDEAGVPYGVAVATYRQDGIFLYEFANAGPCRLLRYLRDHTGTIASLSVSHDGRYLVSAAADQTIKVWSLAGLRNVNQIFPREDAWGATFALRDGQAVVSTAIGPGIAVHRDLLEGDVITRAIYAGPAGIVSTNDPRAIVQALATIPLWETLRLSTERNGQPRDPDIIVVPGWEPVVTLFFDDTGEWAMWTPQGVYDASASGDELFGWHINVNRGQDPQYFRAEKFRRELERPDVMRQLLISGSLQDALIALAVNRPPSIGEVASEIPQLRLLSPSQDVHVPAGQQVVVEAAVRYPENRQPEDFRVQLFVNQAAGGTPQIREENGEFFYSWTVTPVADRNRVLVVVEESSADVGALFQDATVYITADVPEADMTLHVFALSAEKYSGRLALENCNNDARGVIDLLQKHSGERYRLGHVSWLSDQEGIDRIRRREVERQIAAFKQKMSVADSDDILVVFVAGHGQAFGEKYYFVPPDQDLTVNAGQEVVERIGVPWDELRSLSEVRCRKVYLLDTCYSGNIAAAERNLATAEKGLIRPLKKAQAMVFAATSEDETALNANPVLAGHGLFTGFLLEGCNGKADGVDAYAPVHPKFVPHRDGSVNLKEIVSYVSHNVRQTFAFQRPKCTPVELLNFVDLPLFTTQAAPAGTSSIENRQLVR